MLNFEIKNGGSRNANIISMFSENPNFFGIFSNPNSSVMKMFSSLIIFGLLLFLGITISIIGIIVMLVDLKNNKDIKRNY